MQYDDLKRAALLISKQLADPRRLTACPICLGNFSCSLTYEDVPRLREECHELFDRCVLLFMTPRAPDKVAQAQRAASQCRQHRLRADMTINKRLMIILDSVESIVTMALYAGDQSPAARAINTKKAFSNRSGQWPSRLEQLLPLGAEQGVAWLLDLSELRIAGGPLGMLANCVIMARDVVLPVVLSDAHRPRVVSILCKTLTMNPWKSPWNNEPRSVAMAFIDAVNRGPGAVPRHFDLLVSGSEMTVYRAMCQAVCDAPDTPDSQGWLHPLVMCCTKLHIVLNAQSDEPLPLPPKRVQQHLQETVFNKDEKDAYPLLVHMLIKQAADVARCAGPGCGVATLQGGNLSKFQVCARCRIPRYCSKACQARAWKTGTPPHKAVCAVLCKFDAHKNVGGPHSTFEEAYARTLGQLSGREIDVFNAWLTECREEFGTLSECFAGPVDVRVPGAVRATLIWKIYPMLGLALLSFFYLSFVRAVLVTALAVWRIVVISRPFLPYLKFRHGQVFE
ncbi:hypothetical protein AURDEDRAFT_168124 [Auricularia subglabra TFB-10046 SS5]|nr:hypothetical protein AURDEDRAFT_168124 [Auricularia subglabra TFB-10046 SS5]